MRANAGFWLVDQNPFSLPEPPRWWQQRVLAYDKMLRLIPSQTEACYRLCRVARRKARLGLKLIGDLHTHPDTVAMIRFGVVPELTLTRHAIYSDRIIALLRSRDSWARWGGDPVKRAEAIEREEAAAEAVQQAERDAETDAMLTDTFRHVRYGYRVQTRADSLAGTLELLRPLPLLPVQIPPALTRLAF